MSIITPQAKHRRCKETLQEQLERNREQIRALVNENRKIDRAIYMYEDCEKHGVYISDQADINFALENAIAQGREHSERPNGADG